ncbi:MAG: DbpA RNA binding domain-containing protein [Oscillospiraceae bacterium]|nr:DbpA RNA binding domain-containing protein [Oscillospiraceae bacterium]
MDLRQKELFISQFNKFNGLKIDFYAGIDGDSERLIACVFDEYDEVFQYDYPISILKSEINGDDKLNHRDFLGAIMNLMIKREYIGDIIVEDDVCYIACHNQMAPIIISELKKVRHSFVDFEYYYDPVIYSRKYTRHKSVTVASMRADAVISAMLNCSRNEGSTMIKQGLVTVNHLDVKRADFEIVDKDIISIRGKGKYMISFDGAKSRKDRFFITYFKY